MLSDIFSNSSEIVTIEPLRTVSPSTTVEREIESAKTEQKQEKA
jgi:hypothetical protein